VDVASLVMMLARFPLSEIETRLDRVLFRNEFTLESDDHLLAFYHPDTLRELHAWRAYFLRRRNENVFDHIDAWIEMVAINRLAGDSADFFSVDNVPCDQAPSVEAQQRINKEGGKTPEYRETRFLIFKKSRQLLSDTLPSDYARSNTLLLSKPADKTAEIPNQSVKLVITAPPSPDLVDESGGNWLHAWFCQTQTNENTVSQSSSTDQWGARMKSTFVELKRILKLDGIIVLEIGEIHKRDPELEREMIKSASEVGLQTECVILNAQNHTKSSSSWGGASFTHDSSVERVLVLKR